jgi:hypothetical protein
LDLISVFFSSSGYFFVAVSFLTSPLVSSSGNFFEAAGLTEFEPIFVVFAGSEVLDAGFS